MCGIKTRYLLAMSALKARYGCRVAFRVALHVVRVCRREGSYRYCMVRLKVAYLLLQSEIISEEAYVAFASVEVLRLKRSYSVENLVEVGDNLPVFDTTDQRRREVVKVFNGSHKV